MRVAEQNRLEAHSLPEIQRSRRQREVVDGRPKIKLIAAPSTDEAVEEVAIHLHTEAALSVRVFRMPCQETGTSPLGTLSMCRLIGQQGQDLTQTNLLAQGRIVEERHDSDPLGASARFAAEREGLPPG